MFRLAFVVLLVLVLPLAAEGARIVNVQRAASRDAEEGWSGELTGSVQWRTGNTDLTRVAAGLSTLYLTGPHRFFLSGSATYAVESDETSVNNTFEHLRYRHRLFDWLSGEAFVQHEYDEFRRLLVRALAGLGPRLDLPLPPGYTAALGSAWMYEYERLTRDGLPDAGRIERNHRWSNYLAGAAILTEGISVDHTFYVQPRFADFSDYRLLSETAIVLDVKKWLAVRLSFVAAYDARPPADVEKLDTDFGTSLLFRI